MKFNWLDEPDSTGWWLFWTFDGPQVHFVDEWVTHSATGLAMKTLGFFVWASRTPCPCVKLEAPEGDINEVIDAIRRRHDKREGYDR